MQPWCRAIYKSLLGDAALAVRDGKRLVTMVRKSPAASNARGASLSFARANTQLAVSCFGILLTHVSNTVSFKCNRLAPSRVELKSYILKPRGYFVC